MPAGVAHGDEVYRHGSWGAGCLRYSNACVLLETMYLGRGGTEKLLM